MAARAMFEVGECFLRFRSRRPEDGLSVPLQLQMLSSEHLPLGKCETLPNGNEIIFGIELDRIGRRVAYHFHRTHPGDVRQRGTGEFVRVPADQVCHVFHPIAEGQIRGVPWVAPAMVRLWLLDQYDDAELDRKKVAAMFAGFVTRPGPDDVMGEDSAQKDVDGAALIGLQPGTMQLLLPGEDIKFSDPADVARIGAAGRRLSGAETWPGLVVSRQSGGHAPLPRDDDRDRGLLQHRRLQRRHQGIPLHTGAP
jgi:lambda family phage portal protein